MRRAVLTLTAALVLGACAGTPPRPILQTVTTASEAETTLVVGVEIDPNNRYLTEQLARELAFGLSQRGRASVTLPTFFDRAQARGAVIPTPMLDRLLRGGADAETLAWLRAERVASLIFLEVVLYEQVWGTTGKRTRVALSARGRDLTRGEEAWRAYSTPEVEDEPGRGFQLATESALAAIVRVISGEPEPSPITQTVIPSLRLRW